MAAERKEHVYITKLSQEGMRETYYAYYGPCKDFVTNGRNPICDAHHQCDCPVYEFDVDRFQREYRHSDEVTVTETRNGLTVNGPRYPGEFGADSDGEDGIPLNYFKKQKKKKNVTKSSVKTVTRKGGKKITKEVTTITTIESDENDSDSDSDYKNDLFFP